MSLKIPPFRIAIINIFIFILKYIFMLTCFNVNEQLCGSEELRKNFLEVMT